MIAPKHSIIPTAMVATITTKYFEVKEVFWEKEGVVVIFGDNTDDCSLTIIAAKENYVYILVTERYIE